MDVKYFQKIVICLQFLELLFMVMYIPVSKIDHLLLHFAIFMIMPLCLLQFHDVILGNYWDPGRSHIVDCYRELYKDFSNAFPVSERSDFIIFVHFFWFIIQ